MLPFFLFQFAVHGAHFAAENAVHRHAQRGGFAVHRAASADDQVGIPKQIESIHRAAGDNCFAVGEPFS